MPDRPNFESLFLEHLPWIQRVTSIITTKYSMSDADAEDVASWIKLKLAEDDYAVFRNFRGESRLTTYLATVVTGQFHKYRRERWGAAYERPEELHESVLESLSRATGQLAPEDQLIVRMLVQEGRALADVGRALRLDPTSLAQRVERLRLQLREYMEDVQLPELHRPGILGPDGLPITQGDLQRSRIITDVISTNEKIFRLVQDDPNAIFDLAPRQFEELVAELLHKQGYEIRLTPPSNDGGFDMYAARKDGMGEFLYLVECKRYAPARPVGVDIVRSLYGVVQKEEASAGILVTTSRFTKGAAEFQQSVRHRLSLRDYLHLQGWLAGIRI
jgi:DNA-directed RNA polymerase specialized sigma24 family protein